MTDQSTGPKSGHHRFPWWGMGFFVLVCGSVGLCFTGFPGKVKRALEGMIKPRVVEVEKPAAEPDREAIRRQIEARLRADLERKFQSDLKSELARIEEQADERVEKIEQAYLDKPREYRLPEGAIEDVRKLRSGIRWETAVTLEKGGLASLEREDDRSYTARYELKLRLPEAARTVNELEKLTPGLSAMLPGLDACLQQAKVSDWYYQLYRDKAERIRKEAHMLNELLTRHNLYDCETILEFKGAEECRVLLMQAEMDVVSDGSDGDRLATMPPEIVNSTYYQPFTSYGWAKRTTTPNPMLAGWQSRLTAANKELSAAGTSTSRKAWLRERITMLKQGIQDMQGRSFLIAEYDPFIVIPVHLLTSSRLHAPKVGDYAVVVHEGKIYPAIVGDGGPTFKVGEASLRMAKQLNSRADSYNRPVSDLKVTYVVFPGSREEAKGPPDYALWQRRCTELLGKIGGLGQGYALHEWEDLLKPEPPPEVPTPPELIPGVVPALPTPADGAPAPSAAPAVPAPAAPATGR